MPVCKIKPMQNFRICSFQSQGILPTCFFFAYKAQQQRSTNKRSFEIHVQIYESQKIRENVTFEQAVRQQVDGLEVLEVHLSLVKLKCLQSSSCKCTNTKYICKKHTGYNSLTILKPNINVFLKAVKERQ